MMGTKAESEPLLPKRYYRGAGIPMRVIRTYARKIAARFQPDKIILFGSYAYGVPHDDSDVDFLVIMSARDEIDQAIKIRWELPAPFPMDLIVRTAKTISRRLEAGDFFLREVVDKGKVLYEQIGVRMGRLRRGGSGLRAKRQPQ